MNVYKYIYIKFYETRKRVIGESLADNYVCLLFVALVDTWFYLSIIFLVDSCMGYILLPKYPLIFGVFILGGALIIHWQWERRMYRKEFKSIKRKEREKRYQYKYAVYKKGFERIKKEVSEEPRKVFWGIFSLLYVLFAFSFFAISVYIWAKKLIPPFFWLPN